MDTEYGIKVTLTNEDEGHIFSEWVEPVEGWLTTDDGKPNMGDIFRAAQEEWGRCCSSVYVDTMDGPPKKVGWYFVSRQEYEATREPYLRGAWVTVGKYHRPIPEHVTY